MTCASLAVRHPRDELVVFVEPAQRPDLAIGLNERSGLDGERIRITASQLVSHPGEPCLDGTEAELQRVLDPKGIANDFLAASLPLVAIVQPEQQAEHAEDAGEGQKRSQH